MNEFAIFVGIDWASESHQVCVLSDARKVLLERAVRHSGADLVDLADKLVALVGGQAEHVAVAIEVPRGAVVETLLERGIAVFAINPKQLDRFRDRHTVAGAKDDRRDAYVLADSLRTDMPSFRRVRISDPLLIQLRELSRLHDDLSTERVALGNRLREQVHRYFPALLELGSVHDSAWLWTILERAGTPELSRKLSLAKLQSILKTHRIRRITAEQVRTILSQEPVHVAPGVVDACRKHVSLLLPRLRLVSEQESQVEREIAELLEQLSKPTEGKAEHRDALLLLTLPGMGTLGCATMLAEAWQPLEARDYTTLRALCGTAPVTKRSGKQISVIRRMSCNGRLREAMFHWAMNALQHDARSKAHYAELRAAGHTHGRALRGVADRLLAVAVSMLKNSAPYDSARRRALAA